LAVSSSQIDLAWFDDADNENGFEIERKTGDGPFLQIDTVGPGANWIEYNDTGLAELTTYTYRVRAYNAAGYSPFSNEAYATTLEEGEEPPPPPPPDTTPPLPDPSQWAVGGEPRQYYDTNDNNYHHTMTAVLTSDATTGGSEPVQYYFELVSGDYGTQSSGWQLNNVYNYPVAHLAGRYGTYRVKTKDAAGNVTGWSNTLGCGP
jgi:hypothetical protein